MYLNYSKKLKALLMVSMTQKQADGLKAGKCTFKWKLIKTLAQVCSETMLVWHLRNVGKLLVPKVI